MIAIVAFSSRNEHGDSQETMIHCVESFICISKSDIDIQTPPEYNKEVYHHNQFIPTHIQVQNTPFPSSVAPT
jgi:hypothetical protein